MNSKNVFENILTLGLLDDNYVMKLKLLVISFVLDLESKC